MDASGRRSDSSEAAEPWPLEPVRVGATMVSSGKDAYLRAIRHVFRHQRGITTLSHDELFEPDSGSRRVEALFHSLRK